MTAETLPASRGKASMPVWNRSRSGRIDWAPYLFAVIGAAFLLLFLVYPMGKTALLGFVAPGKQLGFSTLTLGNFASIFFTPLNRGALIHSLVVAVCTTGLAVLVALPAAYALARIALPARGLLLTIAVTPLIAPPFIGAYSWVILLGNRGIITRYVLAWTGYQLPPIYGPVGITLALVLSLFPYVLLFVQSALSAADTAIEESAHIMGASRLRILRTVTFPLIMPSIAAGALLVFAQSLGNFGVPSILGRDYMVLTTLIVYQLQGTFNVNGASAIALVSVLLTSIALIGLSRYTRRQRFITVTSTSRAAKRHAGLAARLLGSAYVWLLLLVAAAPQLIVLFNSFVERWPGTLWPTRYGLGNYRFVLGELVGPILNSVYLSGAATLLCVIGGTLCAYIANRKAARAGRILDLMVMLPFVMPGLLTGIAFLVAFNSGWLVLSGTAAIIVLAYVTHRLAYVFRAVSAAVGQVDSRIDEASTVCGARWLTTMRRITVPLVAPGILAGGILVFSTLIMDLSITILLYSPQWKTLALYMFEQLFNNKIGYASASGSIAIVVTAVLVFGASRLIGRGMADMFR